MKSQTFSTKRLTSFSLALACSIALQSASDAALQFTFDLRAVQTSAVNPASVSVGATISNNGHTVVVEDNTLGSTIVFNLYCVFNQNVGTDTFQKTQGALLSSGTTGGLSGSIISAALPSNLSDSAAGAQSGGSNELSALYDNSHGLLTAFTAGSVYAQPSGVSDNITDWGDTVANRNVTPGAWFVAGSAAAQSLSTDAVNASKRSILLGEFKMVLTAGSTGTTTEGFYVRPKGTSAATTPILAVNYSGAARSLNYTGNTGTTVSPNDVYGFQNVSITAALAVPEPTSFAMLMIGSLGLVGFRRPSFRRSA